MLVVVGRRSCPPSPIGRFLFGKKLKQPTSPSAPHAFAVPASPPGACAASSITIRPRRSAIFANGLACRTGSRRSEERRTAFVLGPDRGLEVGRVEVQVVRARDVAEDRCRPRVRDRVRGGDEVERREHDLVARDRTPAASRARCSAAVPLATGERMLAPANSANAASNSSTLGPMLHQPESTTSSTAAAQLVVDENVGQGHSPGSWAGSVLKISSDPSTAECKPECDCQKFGGSLKAVRRPRTAQDLNRATIHAVPAGVPSEELLSAAGSQAIRATAARLRGGLLGAKSGARFGDRSGRGTLMSHVERGVCTRDASIAPHAHDRHRVLTDSACSPARSSWSWAR